MFAADTPMFLVISPHLDDAALSCGGAIHGWVGSGHRVVVATVFTADVPKGQRISRLAERNQRGWGLPDQPFAVRRQEDSRALAELGAESVHLGLMDMIYRCDADGISLYQKTVVGVPVHAADWQLHLPQLQARLQVLAEELGHGPENLHVLCPLALGGHVDHVLVRRAAETVWPQQQLLYYEDFPYAARTGILQDWLAQEGADPAWQPIGGQLSEPQAAARVAAVACYASQLRGLFPSSTERVLEILRARSGYLLNIPAPVDDQAGALRMEIYLRNYLTQAGGERYWAHGPRLEPNVPFLGHIGNVPRPVGLPAA